MQTYPRLRFAAIAAVPLLASAALAGVAVPFSLPPEPGRTYLVTLAAVAPDSPLRIVSTFVAGRPFTVTAENGGRFEAVWNGLDENLMPVPPGRYEIRGIYAPARKWDVDGEFHAIVPRYVGGAGAFLPAATEPDVHTIPVPFEGDPVSSPMVDVDVSPDGRRAVLQYQYLENGRNCPVLDLDRPDGPAQVVAAFPSGGVGGGPVACTDGTTVWACSRDGTRDFVYRADGRPFGPDSAPARSGGRCPEGAVADMAAVPSSAGPRVWLAQRGRIVPVWHPEWNRDWPEESKTDFVNALTVHDGISGETVATAPVIRPHAMAVAPDGGTMFVLHGEAGRLSVARIPLRDGLPAGAPAEAFPLPDGIDSRDLAVDSAGRFYVADPARNHVWRLSAQGVVELRFGRADAQTPGAYDGRTMMGPTRLAVRRDAQGRERLLVVESLGPNRLAEWDCESGAFLRDFPAWQTYANGGWGVDPDHPEFAYLPGHGGWLVRWRMDTPTGRWAVDAVWPGLRQEKGLFPNKFAVLRAAGRLYFASEENLAVYRLSDDGRSLHLSAALLREGDRWLFWNDADGDGAVSDAEKRPCDLPPGARTYHGQKWLPGLVYLAIGQGTPDVWRLAPASFDAHGNPVFESWRKVLTDPVFAARSAGTATALAGASELADTFSSDWMQAVETPDGDLYVQARGGRNFSANFGAQHKLSRYVPDAGGAMRLAWRAGRTDLLRDGSRGAILGAMRVFAPLGGLVSVIDQTRSGVLLYTEDGLYVDTLFAPETFRGPQGVYRQGGEFFVGTVYGDRRNGSVRYAAGKCTPLLFEMENWTVSGNPVRPLESLPEAVELRLADIADPPDIALALRGGASSARLAAFAPAFGGADIAGASLRGWEDADPIRFGPGEDRSVEVRPLWTPEALLLRWHVRTGAKVAPPRLADPVRLFSHDQGADTLSFHFQGDPLAPVPGAPSGRPGDVRFVFGLFRDAKDAIRPVGMAYYPEWTGPSPRPAGFRTPVGATRFAHVAPIAGARYGWALDDDGLGFVLAVAIPRGAFPRQDAPFSGTLRTRCNFEANLGGHNRLWWANADGSASAETWDEPTEARLFPGSWAPMRLAPADAGLVPREWSVLGPFGGPATAGWSYDPSPAQKPLVAELFDKTSYAPDARLAAPDFAAAYSGPETTGWWGAPEGGAVRWKTATLAETDTRLAVGPGAQLWYGTVAIHAAHDLDATLELHGHPMTTARWFLDGEDISPPPADWRDDPSSSHFRRVAERRVRLHRGVNRLLFRGYCVGYPPFRLGARILPDDPDAVWSLRTSPR